MRDSQNLAKERVVGSCFERGSDLLKGSSHAEELTGRAPEITLPPHAPHYELASFYSKPEGREHTDVT